MINSLQRAIIEKTGHDYGFEYVLPGTLEEVQLASARHRVRASDITYVPVVFFWLTVFVHNLCSASARCSVYLIRCAVAHGTPLILHY